MKALAVSLFERVAPGIVPDPFQFDALIQLLSGCSVVVSAPTGTGKTLIAEALTSQALASGQRLFYTTPLKALSNQKFRDMGKLFGERRCGLLTGDISIRPDADLVVMTTEVFRNMVVRCDRDERLQGLACVVLDECHYIGQWGRGTVWEESILGCPPDIRLLALSATIQNARKVADWFDAVHPHTVLVESHHRPVPLRFFFCRSGKLHKLSPEIPGRKRSAGTFAALDDEDPSEVVEALDDQSLLPAIYFLFSRRGCEAAMQMCAHLQLLSDAEAEDLETRLDELIREHPSLESYPFLGLLIRGMAVHHAGMLPVWKAAIERLFQRKLVKVVFATETLAAGINMPARTTVISSLRRPGDNGFRPLSATEFHQMSGRAGRRGMDAWGSVVILSSPRSRLTDAQLYMQSMPEPLGSCLSPGYSLVLNWLPDYGEEGAYRLIAGSLGSFAGRAFEPDQSGGPSTARRAGGKRARSEFASTRQVGGGGSADSRTALPLAKASAGDTARRSSPAWKRFRDAWAVLDRLHLLEDRMPVGVGVLAASFQAENELLAAQVFHEVLPSDPTPMTAAALAGCLAGVSRSSPSTGRTRTVRLSRVSRVTRGAMNRATSVAAQLRKIQRDCGFLCSTTLSLRFGEMAAAWCAGAGWAEILDSTDLDEGDIVYGMRNTIDLLDQLARSPAEESLRVVASEARLALDRVPVSEIL